MDAPPDALAWRTPRALSYWAMRYRRSWRRSLVPSLLGPCVYLLAMGVVMGKLVDRHGTAPAIDGGSYLEFVAPAIVAVAAMMAATAESAFPVFAALHTTRSYTAMTATPLRIGDIVVGHLLWAAVRIAFVTTVLVALVVALGAAGSWTVVLVIPAGVLTGLAFSASLMGFAATARHDSSMMGWQRFGMTPMLLFCGILYPISQLPPALQVLAKLTPLWHGAQLCRALAAGSVDALAVAGHVLALVAFVALGLWWALRAFARQLLDR